MDSDPGLLGTFFGHQIAMKMFHFQTKSYGAHKAVDAYADTFGNNFDRFMEVAQGELGDLKSLKQLSLKVNLVTDQTVMTHLDVMIEFLRAIELNGEALSSELDGVRGEMVAEIQKLKYLLRKQ
jgi:hypothetical protein